MSYVCIVTKDKDDKIIKYCPFIPTLYNKLWWLPEQLYNIGLVPNITEENKLCDTPPIGPKSLISPRIWQKINPQIEKMVDRDLSILSSIAALTEDLSPEIEGAVNEMLGQVLKKLDLPEGTTAEILISPKK